MSFLIDKILGKTVVQYKFSLGGGSKGYNIILIGIIKLNFKFIKM